MRIGRKKRNPQSSSAGFMNIAISLSLWHKQLLQKPTVTKYLSDIDDVDDIYANSLIFRNIPPILAINRFCLPSNIYHLKSRSSPLPPPSLIAAARTGAILNLKSYFLNLFLIPALLLDMGSYAVYHISLYLLGHLGELGD